MKTFALAAFSAAALAAGLSGCSATAPVGGAPGAAAAISLPSVTLSSGAQILLADVQKAVKALPAICTYAQIGATMTSAELTLLQSVAGLPAKTAANINNGLAKGVIGCAGTDAVLQPLAALGQ
jgi:hypothetical protein